MSDRQLQHLQATQSQKPVKPGLNAVTKLKIIALTLVMLTLGANLYYILAVQFSSQRIEQRIADEVAGNHLKLRPLEIQSARLQAMKHYFDKLNFIPVRTDLLE